MAKRKKPVGEDMGLSEVKRVKQILSEHFEVGVLILPGKNAEGDAVTIVDGWGRTDYCRALVESGYESVFGGDDEEEPEEEAEA